MHLSANPGRWRILNTKWILSEVPSSSALPMYKAPTGRSLFNLIMSRLWNLPPTMASTGIKLLSFGVCDAPRPFTETAHKLLGHIPELLIYIDYLRVFSATWENHLNSLESMFVAPQAAAPTFKQSRLAFGTKSVQYLGLRLKECQSGKAVLKLFRNYQPPLDSKIFVLV